MCNGAESSRAEISPIELAIKFKGKSKIGVSVCLVTLEKVALGGVLHVIRYCIAVFAHAALYVIGYYMTVTACAILQATLGMLS